MVDLVHRFQVWSFPTSPAVVGLMVLKTLRGASARVLLDFSMVVQCYQACFCSLNCFHCKIKFKFCFRPQFHN